jgi:hypothetical protein
MIFTPKDYALARGICFYKRIQLQAFFGFKSPHQGQRVGLRLTKKNPRGCPQGLNLG